MSGTEDDPIPIKEGEIPQFFAIPPEFNQSPPAIIIVNPHFNDRGIIVSRREHPMYAVGKMIIAQDHGFPPLPPPFGKYQYFYQSQKGLIDMITQPAGLYGPRYPETFEICSGSKFFEGPERYFSREEAEKRIMDLLATK